MICLAASPESFDAEVILEYKKLFSKLDITLSKVERSHDVSETLQAMMRSIVDEFNEELGIIAARLWANDGDVYVLQSQYGVRKKLPDGLTIPSDYRPIRTVVEKGYVFMSSEDEGFDARLEERLGVTQFAAVSLGEDGDYLIGFTVSPGTDADQVRLSLNTIRHTVNLKLRQEELESLIEEAKRIQLSLLPSSAPEFADYDIAGRSDPAEAVGGDLYDYLSVSKRILGVAVGDSSGHGLPAALQARDVITGMRVAINEDYKIVRAIERLNRVISRGSPAARYISLFYGELEANGNLIYCNAGHPPPLVYRKGVIRRLARGGLVLGPNPDALYDRGYERFRRGTAMLIYTDGLSEATAADGEEFGVERLADLLREHNERPAAEIVDRVFEAVAEFTRGPVADDRTAVVIRRPAPPSET